MRTQQSIDVLRNALNQLGGPMSRANAEAALQAHTELDEDEAALGAEVLDAEVLDDAPED